MWRAEDPCSFWNGAPDINTLVLVKDVGQMKRTYFAVLAVCAISATTPAALAQSLGGGGFGGGDFGGGDFGGGDFGGGDFGGGDFGGGDFGGGDFGGGDFGGGDIGSGDFGGINAGDIQNQLNNHGINVDINSLAALAKAKLPTLTDTATKLLSTEIGEGRDFCFGVPGEYKIACIADRFDAIADQLPRSGEYREIRKHFQNASRDLHKVAKEYRNPQAAKQRFKGGDVRTARLTPVDPGRRKKAEAEAKAVIANLETVLLRSAEEARERKVLYRDIAQAVGSNKVLLRS